MPISAAQNNGYDLVTSDNSWTQAQALALLESGTALFDGDIIGRQLGTGNAIHMKLRGFFRRDTSGVVLSLLGSAFDTLLADRTLGAALWDARLRLESDGYVYLDVKGKSSADVHWSMFGNFVAWLDS